MAKEKKLSGRSLDKLYQVYDEKRREAKEAEHAKQDAADEIKKLLGDAEEASTPNYIVTYAYDKDRPVFDATLFEQKDPKGYEKYCAALENIEMLEKKYTKTVKGARKLIVTATAE